MYYYTCTYICMHVCTVCDYVFMYMCTCTYVCMYVYLRRNSFPLFAFSIYLQYITLGRCFQCPCISLVIGNYYQKNK